MEVLKYCIKPQDLSNDHIEEYIRETKCKRLLFTM